MPPLHAARVKKKIVKIPENEIVVALGGSKPVITGSFWFEKNLAINQQRKKLNPWKSILAAQPF